MTTGVASYLVTVSTGVKNVDSSHGDAWTNAYTCPHCGGRQLFRLGMQVDRNYKLGRDMTQWFRCPGCLRGSVFENGAVHPSTQPLREPSFLPPDVALTWNEARVCLGAGAYAAAVLMCRKLLLHLAVEHGLPAKNKRDRAPTFVECVDRLEHEGVVTKRMRPWVERIKDVGNDATHELAPVTSEQAQDVADYTLHLLVTAYEVHARVTGEFPTLPGD